MNINSILFIYVVLTDRPANNACELTEILLFVRKYVLCAGQSTDCRTLVPCSCINHDQFEWQKLLPIKRSLTHHVNYYE